MLERRPLGKGLNIKRLYPKLLVLVFRMLQICPKIKYKKKVEKVENQCSLQKKSKEGGGETMCKDCKLSFIKCTQKSLSGRE